MQCFVIPTILGDIGTVSKGLKKSRNNTRKSFNRLSTKLAILGAPLIIRKVLQSET
jgi:membrane-anchored glycerophosphoryl diester phosphodiesterase (GDPDase)